MKQRFVVLADEISKEQQDVITAFFKEQPTGYWHWFKDSWLIIDISNVWSVAKIRDKIQELVPGVNVLVLKVESGTDWAGFGRKDKFEWLHETWVD